MGLRFRKSVSLFPGVKLNFGTTGMSVSTGVPGFRKTFHTSGRVTTSVGIPGTGLYYVDTKNTKRQSDRRTSQTQSSRSTDSSLNQRHDTSAGSQASYDVWDAYSSANEEADHVVHTPVNQVEYSTEHDSVPETVQLDTASLKQAMILLIGLKFWFLRYRQMNPTIRGCGSIIILWLLKSYPAILIHIYS